MTDREWFEHMKKLADSMSHLDNTACIVMEA